MNTLSSIPSSVITNRVLFITINQLKQRLLRDGKWTITNMNAVSLWMVFVYWCTGFNYSGINADMSSACLGCAGWIRTSPCGTWHILPTTVCRWGLPLGIMAGKKKGWTRGNWGKNARNEGWAQPSRSVQRQHVQWTLSGTSSGLRTHIFACLWVKNLWLNNP